MNLFLLILFGGLITIEEAHHWSGKGEVEELLVHLKYGGDHDLDGEDFPVASQEYAMVTNLTCPKCDSFVEVYLPSYHFSEKKKPIDTAPCSVEDDTVCDI